MSKSNKGSLALMEAQDDKAPVKAKKDVKEKPNVSPEEFLNQNIERDKDVRVSIKKITESAFRVNFIKAMVKDEGMHIKDFRIFKSQFLVVVTNDDDGTMKIVDRSLG